MDLDTRKRIEEMINKNQVFLFMKGTPERPKCGFSFSVVQILKELHVDFESFDVLEDMEIRQGIKEFSDWPTIPQLYINGNFIGGAQICDELYADGELQKLLGL